MRTPVTVLAIALTLLLAGCGSDSRTDDGRVKVESTTDTYVNTVTVPLPDGEEVICAVLTGRSKGGLSCDWEGAAKKSKKKGSMQKKDHTTVAHGEFS